MNHSGKATQAGLRLIGIGLLVLIVLAVGGLLATVVGSIVTVASTVLLGVWFLFALFTLYFFRDPTPRVPGDSKAIVAPAYGKVDLVDEVDEPSIMGGRCKRVSIFLSVFDVHVQYAPVSGKIASLKQTQGKFLNAMKAESCLHNENVLIGFDSTEAPGEKIGVRLIAGLIARRIVPYVQPGEGVNRADRISLIQFGSRVDIYLPLSAKVVVELGQKVRGGETVLAVRN